MFCASVEKYNYQRSQSEQIKPNILNRSSLLQSRSGSKIGPMAMQTIAIARQVRQFNSRNFWLVTKE